MTTDTIAARVGEGLAVRWRRALPRRMAAPVTVVVAVGYGLAVALSGMVLTGWRGPDESLLGGATTYWPLESSVTLATLGVISVGTTLGAVRSGRWARLALSVVAVVLVLLGLDAVSIGPARIWILLVGLGCAGVALALPVGSVEREVARCALAAVPFVLGAVAQSRSSEVDKALAALRDAQFAPSSAIGLSLLTIFAVASSVEGHRERAERLTTWHISRRAVLVAVLVKLALLVALYLHLTGDFLGGPTLWRPRLDQPLSWLHAILVGGTIALVGTRSLTRPVRASGFTPRLAALTVVLAVMETAAVLALVALTVISTLAPTVYASTFLTAAGWVVDHVYAIQLSATGLILLAAAIELTVTQRLTTGRYLWLVAGIWLLPPLAGIAFASGGSVTAWATPGQVDAVLTLIVLVLLFRPIGRRGGSSARTLMALVIVPLLVLHLGNLWPSEWTDSLLRVTVVASVAIALLLNPPPVSGDTRQVERSRSLAVAGQLGILVAYLHLLTNADLTSTLGTSATIAWLWLAVPITAVLTVRVSKGATAPPSQPAMASVTPPVRHSATP
jgi:hypothetical protein